MFWGVRRGRRAKVASSLAIERNTPLAISEGFENPAIVRFFIAMRRRRGTRTSRSFAKLTEREGKAATSATAIRATKYSNNPATAEDQLTRIKNRSLTGGDRALRLIEMHFDTRSVSGRGDGRRGGLMLIADLDLGPDGSQRRRDRDPVHVVNRHGRAQQRIVPADHNALRSRLRGNDVKRFGGR